MIKLHRKRKKFDDLKYDFMPQLLEIVETPPNRSSVFLVIIMISLLVTAIIWACFSKIDTVVTVTGVVNSKSGERQILASVSGQIQEMKVQNGQQVEQGQELIVLDSSSLSFSLAELQKQLSLRELQVTLLGNIGQNPRNSVKAVSAGIESVAETEAIKSAHQLYLSRVTSYANQCEETERKITELEAKLATLQNQFETTEIATTQSLIQQYVAQLTELQDSLKEIEISYQHQIASQTAEINTQITDLKIQIGQISSSSENSTIVAPIAGFVIQDSSISIGQPVSLGQELLRLVPDDGGLEVSLSVPDAEIAGISLGDNLDISINAFPEDEYGVLVSKVDSISASALPVEGIGRIFMVKGNIKNKAKKMDIRPGMTVSADIKTGNKTVIKYFLDPIIKGLKKGLKE